MVKIGELRERYAFRDISVFVRMDNGLYSDMSGYFLTEERIHTFISSEAPFVLAFCAFAKDDLYISEATIEDLLALADITNPKFISQVRSGMESDLADQILAMICANKVFNYAYGKCACSAVKNNEYTYQFTRQKWTNTKRHYPVVLEKTFRPNKVVSSWGGRFDV